MEPVGLIPPLLGAPVVDAAGAPAGAVADLLADPATGRPAWAVVRLPAGATVTVPHAILRSHARDLALPCGADHLAAAAAARPGRRAVPALRRRAVGAPAARRAPGPRRTRGGGRRRGLTAPA